ncbi:MAG: hypothetical protein BWY78_00291 [Alphaproteobacteria bacterium ADurb.Bin438]|nr:MAG: hypothetical protein BWY78_00291 [Alphaproteobacteria bacterium ADurb.Bin438]
MISGARSSINLFKRLLRLITRRYKSFKSEVANLPPSKGTKGLNSGGITGTTSNTIHSGFAPDSMKDSYILSLFTILAFFASELVSFNSSLNFKASLSTLTPCKISFNASAPIPTRKASSPKVSTFA